MHFKWAEILSNRAMLHPPWNQRPIRGKDDEAKYPQPGYIITRIINAYREAGGDTHLLFEKLNGCLPEGYQLQSDNLLEYECDIF